MSLLNTQVLPFEAQAFHQGQFQLQCIVHTVCVMHKDVLFCYSVLSQLHHFESETFLHQSEFLVRAEQHRFSMLKIDGITFAILFLGD